MFARLKARLAARFIPWFDRICGVCEGHCEHGKVCRYGRDHGCDHESVCCRFPLVLAPTQAPVGP